MRPDGKVVDLVYAKESQFAIGATVVHLVEPLYRLSSLVLDCRFFWYFFIIISRNRGNVNRRGERVLRAGFGENRVL